MKLIKRKPSKRMIPARTEYFVRLTRPNGEVIDWYNGQSYRTAQDAQAYCDRRSKYKASGIFTVASVERPAHKDYGGFSLVF